MKRSMDLILWRHAEAEIGEPDHGRSLTAKGRRHAARMAGWLDRNLPAGCRVLSSPAERCLQTANALGRKYRVVDELAPGSTAMDVLDAAGWPDSREPVLIIGHQPVLGQVISLLLTGVEGEWTVRKANVCWISNRMKDEATRVVLRSVIGPDFFGG